MKKSILVSRVKKIGLVGGLGPASTVDYYLGLVERFRKSYGDDVYPEIVIDSVNMHDVISGIADKDYDHVSSILVKSMENLKKAGADFAAITSNTPHIVWNLMQDSFCLPVISIVDATIERIQQCGFKKVLVLGTEFTMRSGLYEESLMEKGITPIIPSEEDIKILGSIIYPNLENGIVIAEDKKKMIKIAEKYIKSNNAEAFLLGCTEIPLMIKEKDVSVPTLNTTQIHIDAIFENLK